MKTIIFVFFCDLHADFESLCSISNTSIHSVLSKTLCTKTVQILRTQNVGKSPG